MRLIGNIGADRVIDQLHAGLAAGAKFDASSDGLSLFAFHALHEHVLALSRARLLLPGPALRQRSVSTASRARPTR